MPLPSGTDAQDAFLMEPLGMAVHGFRLAGLRGDMRVAVVGGGAVGQTALVVAGLAGCEVAISACHDLQKGAAERLGAVPLTEQPYGIVVEAAGTGSALVDAVKMCRPGGKVVILGSYWGSVELPGIEISMKEITLVPSSMYGRHGPTRDMDVAAAALAQLPELPDAIITHRFPLDAPAEAFAAAANRASGAIKVVLEP